jgi:membrane-associated protein
MTLIGYYLGHFAWVRRNIEIVIILVVFLSILPGIIAFLREKMKGKSVTQEVLGEEPIEARSPKS